MKKNWSYVAAMMLIAASGVGLTGCIDNDEPKGIYEIRVATANLLEAKKAAAEAEAAAAKLDLEIKQLEVELEKARIEAQKEKDAAQAEIDKLLAEAQAAKTQAEADVLKAKADAIRAKAIAEANYRQAQTDALIAKTQNCIDRAKLAYDKLVYEWERTKVANATADNDALYKSVRSYYEAYIWNLKQYNNLNERYLASQQKAARWDNDLVENKGKWESPKYNIKGYFEGQVAMYENKVKYLNEDIDECNAFNDKLATINASELGKLLSEYKDSLQVNTERLAKARIQNETLALNNKGAKDEYEALLKEYNDLETEDIAIPSYTIPAQPNIPFFKSETTLPYGNVGDTYTLKELTNSPYDNNYFKTVNQYNGVIATLQAAMMDENDKAWTSASVTLMQRQLEAANAAYQNAVNAWKLAKSVYNFGGVANASVLPNAADIDAAIDAYETAGGAIASLRQAKISAAATQSEAYTAYVNALNAFAKEPTSVVNVWNQANIAFQTAYNNAQAAYDKAVADANNQEQVANQEAQRAKEATQEAFNIAEKNLQAANLELAENPKDETAKQNQKDAQTAYNKALENVTNADKVLADAIQKAQKTKTTALNLAKATLLKAQAAASTAHEEAKKAFFAAGGYDNEKDPAYKPVQEASEAYNKAQEAYQAASDALNNANPWKVYDAYEAILEPIQAQENAIDYSWNLNNYYNVESDVMNYCYADEAMDLPTVIAPALDKDEKQIYYNALQYLVHTSIAAYGKLGVSYDNTGEYGFYEPDQAFLVDEVSQKLVDEYIAAKYPDTAPYNYYIYYNLFNLRGTTLELETKIEMAKAYLTNSTAITTVLDGVEKSLKSIQDTETAKKEERQAVYTEYETKQAAYQKLFTDVNAVIENLYGREGNLKRIISLIEDGIVAINFPEANGNKAVVQNMITLNNNSIQSYTAQLAELEKALEYAQYQLDQFNSGEADYNVNPFENEVASLEAQVAAAKAELDFIKQALDVAQERYSKATGTTTEGGEEAE